VGTTIGVAVRRADNGKQHPATNAVQTDSEVCLLQVASSACLPSNFLHFRYRDRLTGKGVKARYVAEKHELAARHTEWEIIGPPDIREVGLLATL